MMQKSKSKKIQKYTTPDRQKLYSLFMQIPAFICVLKGKDYIYEMANKQYYQIIGHRKIIGKPLVKALPELKTQDFIKILNIVCKTKKSFVENGIKVALQRKKNGLIEDRFVNFVYQPIIEDDKTVSGVFVHGVDITDELINKKKIEESEERYRTLFNSVDEGFCIVDIIFNKKNKPIDYRFLEVNRVFEELTGITNPVGKTIREIAPDIEPIWYQTLGKVVLTGKSVRFDSRSEALNRWFTVYGTKIGGPESKKVAVIFNNILPEKKAEEIQKRLAAIVESSDDAIIGKNLDGIITSWNNGAEKIFGYTPEEIIGKSIRTIIPPELQNEEDKILAQLKQGKRIEHFQTIRVAKDGTRINISITVSPIKNSEGEIIGASKIARDITQQMNLQRQKDDFMGIVSHELKTPVTSIKAFAQVLQSRFTKAGDEKSSALLGKMNVQINKLTNLIDDLLDVTKIETGKLQFNKNNFYFDELVDEIIEEMQRTTTHHQIEKVGVTKKIVYGDRDRVGQVIINMLTNAIKYSPYADKVIVKLSADKKNVQLSIQDFGIGIPKKKQQQVFERFYRVNDASSNSVPGIGLGMYISAEIINRQNGKIWLESNIGKGSTFYFSLPLEKNKIKDNQFFLTS